MTSFLLNLQKLSRDLEGALNSPTFSDLRVVCEDREWQVHKVVVCTRSKFFLKACTIGFSESHSGVVNIEEEEPSYVQKMLQYLYSGDYAVDQESSPTEQAHFHILMCRLGDKFEVAGLEDLAASKLRFLLSYTPAEPEWVSLVHELYIEAPKSFNVPRKIVLGAILPRARYLRENHDFREALEKVEGFAADLLLLAMESSSHKPRDIGSAELDPTTFDFPKHYRASLGTDVAPFWPQEGGSVTDQNCWYQAISFRAPYLDSSFEELRIADYSQGRVSGELQEPPLEAGEGSENENDIASTHSESDSSD